MRNLLKWYWRYHRHENDLDWASLSTALRDRYKGYYTDFDIMEDIHRRKQRNSETFDEFFNAISALTDRLKKSITECDLCAILVRNLRTEIRHELLHLDITTISRLRHEVKKHEKFVKDMANYESRKSAKVRVAEIDVEDNVEQDDTEVCAIRLEMRCWNCDKQGHNYMDCVEVRRVFCYGCGAKDTYRPSCPKCSKKQGNVMKDVRRH